MPGLLDWLDAKMAAGVMVDFKVWAGLVLANRSKK